MLTVITHSFPTRRPSDLDELKVGVAAPGVRPAQRRADPRLLRSQHAPERERALGRQQVAVRPAALQPNPLAGAIARAGGERARRAGLLGKEHGHIFGIVTGTLDRKRVVSGKSVSVGVNRGGGRTYTQKKTDTTDFN